MPRRNAAGRPQGSTSAETRERILDVAEALFANDGFDGTSIRQIALAAGISIAVVNHHFGLKEALFEQVVRRRAALLNERREAFLANAIASFGEAPIPVETLVRGYILPFLDFSRRRDPHWQNYAVLMGRLANSPRGTAIIHVVSGAIAEKYVRELVRSLPEVSTTDILTGFLTMVSGMLTFSAATGRFENLSVAFNCEPDLDRVAESLVRFCVQGFTGPKS